MTVGSRAERQCREICKAVGLVVVRRRYARRVSGTLVHGKGAGPLLAVPAHAAANDGYERVPEGEPASPEVWGTLLNYLEPYQRAMTR